ncbi:hypothetical protein ACI2L1_36700 [Streptomyces sp. NPDC019531]|uniref:hypothetical protein n=1 Tax=Streptomyces sp. NPDC019531 TaxID=3365062 RepID=UPI0038518068
MGQLMPLLIVVGALVVVLGLFIALAAHVRRRGTAGGGLAGVLAAYDEAFHGTAADSYHEIQEQKDRKAPLPDDRWKRGPRSGPGA